MFVVAGASRESGNKILAAVYPDHHFLYLGLALGLPSIIFMWLISLRRPERIWLNRVVSSARAITFISIFAQLMQTSYQIVLSHGAFSWPNALTLVVLVWFAMYIIRSRSVRDSLKTPIVE